MRKVINGKTYRIHAASLIITLPSHFPKTDNKWHETRLYRTQQGAYFLAGEGGTGSRWAKITPRGAIAGEGIKPISKDEARAYAQYAGLSPDSFARAGFEREEGNWRIDALDIQGDHVIGRTV